MHPLPLVETEIPVGGTMRPLPFIETEIPIAWTWYLQQLLINLVFCLLLLGALLLISYYTQEDISRFVEQ